MDKRPKRRKDKYNPYTLCSEKGKYYVYFVDVNNRIQMVEVVAFRTNRKNFSH